MDRDIYSKIIAKIRDLATKINALSTTEQANTFGTFVDITADPSSSQSDLSYHSAEHDGYVVFNSGTTNDAGVTVWITEPEGTGELANVMVTAVCIDNLRMREAIYIRKGMKFAYTPIATPSGHSVGFIPLV